MNTETKPKNLRLDAIDKIKEGSTCLIDLHYNKRTKDYIQMRVKPGGHVFILQVFGDGVNGLNIYYPDPRGMIIELMENFEKYGTTEKTT